MLLWFIIYPVAISMSLCIIYSAFIFCKMENYIEAGRAMVDNSAMVTIGATLTPSFTSTFRAAETALNGLDKQILKHGTSSKMASSGVDLLSKSLTSLTAKLAATEKAFGTVSKGLAPLAKSFEGITTTTAIFEKGIGAASVAMDALAKTSAATIRGLTAQAAAFDRAASAARNYAAASRMPAGGFSASGVPITGPRGGSGAGGRGGSRWLPSGLGWMATACLAARARVAAAVVETLEAANTM
jgi:hypothetical protein